MAKPFLGGIFREKESPAMKESPLGIFHEIEKFVDYHDSRLYDEILSNIMLNAVWLQDRDRRPKIDEGRRLMSRRAGK